MAGYPVLKGYAKCRAPKRCWVSSVNAAGAVCPLNELYRQLFNPELYFLAYGNIYSNKGAMTPGPDGETAERHVRRGKIGRRSSMRCATSATGSSPCDGSTYQEKWEAQAPIRNAVMVG